jgi:hypothetical protein
LFNSFSYVRDSPSPNVRRRNEKLISPAGSIADRRATVAIGRAGLELDAAECLLFSALWLASATTGASGARAIERAQDREDEDDDQKEVEELRDDDTSTDREQQQ